MTPKLKEVIGVQEAIDNLAAISEIDMKSPSPIGILKKTRIVTNEEEFPRSAVDWLSGEGSEAILELIDLTYHTLYMHLQSLNDNPETDWENEKTVKGVAAMMTLAGEAADKIDQYLAYRLGRAPLKKTSEREAFRLLQSYYREKFIKKMREEELEPQLDTKELGLKDFESIKRDKEYELFYIQNEEGESYFNLDLLRNIKLTVDFSLEGEGFEEDPLLKVRTIEDRDLQCSAAQILGECRDAISDFMKIEKSYVENKLIEALNRAVFALFLAANPRHLIQNTLGKSSLEYFSDFHMFLREALLTVEYQKWIAYPPERGDKGAHFILHLAHLLCQSLFKRAGGIKQESIGMIYRAMHKGEKIKQDQKKPLLKGETLWNRLLLDDENMRTLMAKFPHGPLFKILDIIRDQESSPTPFDPIAQGNLPLRLYEVELKGRKIDVLKIPSPTRQAFIHRAEVVEEFQGFLRSYMGNHPKVHLIVNLQDKTSWKESARSRSIERLEKNAEFSDVVYVLTLPKDTDFYHQNSEYMQISSASDFIHAFKEQLKAPEECGFSFPSKFKPSELSRFADSLLPLIHTHFFHGKNSLTRRNREDFIEIFYQFLLLKVVDTLKVDSMSFTCKDGIDTGAAGGGLFYAFLQLFTNDLSKKEEQDFFRWLLYSPALLIRERAIDIERFIRAVTALERIDGEISEKNREIVKNFSHLYDPKLFKSLKVRHL